MLRWRGERPGTTRTTDQAPPRTGRPWELVGVVRAAHLHGTHLCGCFRDGKRRWRAGVREHGLCHRAVLNCGTSHAPPAAESTHASRGDDCGSSLQNATP